MGGCSGRGDHLFGLADLAEITAYDGTGRSFPTPPHSRHTATTALFLGSCWRPGRNTISNGRRNRPATSAILGGGVQACHHVALLTAEALLRGGIGRGEKVLDLKGRLRCRGCGRKGRVRGVHQVAGSGERSEPG
jgi:hypothetical protein